MRIRPGRLAILSLLTLCSLVQAQLSDPSPRPLVGARNLALSPDGSRLAFTYRGDVWVGPAEGGRAAPITNHVEMDDNACWSPDGKWIAFASNRYGNTDIFAVPADGGETKRLTWFTGSEYPSDWSPDGKRILFRGTRDNPENGIYELDVRTLQFKPLFLDMMPVGNPRYSPDGKSVIYNRLQQFPWNRPRYQGSGAAQIWRFDLATQKRTQIRNNGFQNLWVNPTDGANALLVTVSEKTPSSSYAGKPIPKNVDNVNRTPNVYSLDGRGSARRLTDLVGGGARFLTAAKDGSAAFEYEGDLYRLKPGGKPQKLAFFATIDDKFTNEERLILTTGANDITLSPKADTIVFEARSELWSVPIKKEKGPNADDAEQLTDWEGIDEQPLYAPDGKSVFFVSDRDGARNLYRLDLESKKAARLTQGDHDVFALYYTPDKKKLSYWLTGPQGGLYTIPVEGAATPEKVLAKTGNGPQQYAWSPDGRFVAYTDQLPRSGYYYWESGTNVWIYDTVEKKSHNVTQENVPNGSPSWSPDGKYLYFRRDGGGGGVGPRGGASGGAVYILPLRQEEARDDDLQLKYEKPAGVVKVDIDFEDIENRSRRFIGQDPRGPVRVDKEKGDIYFVSEGDLWKSAYDGTELRRLTSAGAGSPVGNWDLSDDGKQIYYTRGGSLNLMDITKPNTPVTTVAFRADWKRDVRLERKAAFNQFWREYNRSFYDGNFHGRDWAQTKKRYEPLLDSVAHRNEMATLLNMMVGELESSHSEAGAAPGNPSSESSAHPGFTLDYSYVGPGLKVKEVPKGAPGSYEKTRIKPGEYVMQINGKDVRADEALFRDVLNEQTSRDITLTINSTPSLTGARKVKYRALSGGAFAGIVRHNLLEWRKKYVEERSGGKLTYVHIAGMGGGNFDQFQREFWQSTQGKQGAIIDVRNNGGGNISDRLIDIIERQPNAIYKPRDEEPQEGPGQTWAKPTVVMMGETSFSNAEMFPAAMKARKLATLVGMPTPGYVIYTGGFRLVDGTNARMPGTGVFRLDGSPLENLGEQPDYKVDWSPEDYFANKDPQLDKAIEVLMGKVK